MRFFAKMPVLLTLVCVAWAKLPECPLNASGHVRVAVIQIKHFAPTQIYLTRSDGRGGNSFYEAGIWVL